MVTISTPHRLHAPVLLARVTAICALALAGLQVRARGWLSATRDDEGLASPEKAALTVLGLALAAIVAAAAIAYVKSKVALFK